MIPLRQRVKDLRLSATFKYGAAKTPEDWPTGTHSYKVTIRCRKNKRPRQFTTEYHMGPGITKDPTVADVVNCLALDALSYENSSGFSDFCEEFGFDSDLIKAKKTYKGCRKASERLIQLLGSYRAMHELLYDTEFL